MGLDGRMCRGFDDGIELSRGEKVLAVRVPDADAERKSKAVIREVKPEWISLVQSDDKRAVVPSIYFQLPRRERGVKARMSRG